MQGSLDSPPIIIRARRWYPQMTWAVLLIGLAAASQGLMFLAPGVKTPPTAYVAGPLFGLLLVMALARVVWPGRMEVGPDGVVVRALFRTRRRSWGEAFAFRPVRYRGVEFVGYDIPAGAPAGSALGRAVARNAGADGLLAGHMELDGDDLAELLNQARARWTLESPTPAPIATVPRGVRAWSAYLALASGRMSRKAYWIATGVAAVCVVLAILTPKPGPTLAPLALIPWWLAARSRMRDLGRAPAWLALFALPPAIAFVLTAVVAAAFEVRGDLTIAGAAVSALLLWEGLVTVLVLIGQIVLLGALPGQTGRNRYGASPLGEDPALDAIFS